MRSRQHLGESNSRISAYDAAIAKHKALSERMQDEALTGDAFDAVSKEEQEAWTELEKARKRLPK